MPAYTIDPHPLFAGPESMVLGIEQYYARYPCVAAYLKSFSTELDVEKDFKWSLRFLARHNRAPGTFGNYRTFVERLLLWSWVFAGKSALTLNRDQFGQFLSFCKKPPSNWVGASPAVRFIQDDGNWTFNEGWRPFDIRSQTEADSYRPFRGTLRQIHSICSSFYNFLHAEDAAALNPVTASRSHNGNAESGIYPVRRYLSSDQLYHVLRILECRAVVNPTDERALFIVAATVFMYLRAADLAKSGEYCPSMDCFVLEDGKWWLVLDAPGTPSQRLAVNPKFLPYLKRYRKSRGLSPLPEQDEGVPMLETSYGRPGLSVRQIRDIVQGALRQVHAAITSSGECGDHWNVLLGSSLRFLRDSGARSAAQTREPAELQRDLRITSIAYTYGRYYRE
ncbi:integrase [Stutzerimonas stutzeri]|uniref:integrase n=1 Tax=Stutzerimonas stutzeri TaxID=316 RepID=UPI001F388924|nr:integrase [Stutzerimonas stutzeri]